MIATRIPIERVLPGVRLGQIATLDKVFLPARRGKVRQLSISTPAARREVAAPIVSKGDFNRILFDHLLKQRPKLRAWALQREQEMARRVLEGVGKVYAINPRALDWEHQEELLQILRAGGIG
jgi:hypothetical protein